MAVELHLLLDDLSKDEGKQLLVIRRLVDVFSEALIRTRSANLQTGEREVTCPFEGLLDAHLLRVDKTTDCNLYREVDIIRSDVLAQIHLCARFGHPNHRLEVPHGDREGASG